MAVICAGDEKEARVDGKEPLAPAGPPLDPRKNGAVYASPGPPEMPTACWARSGKENRHRQRDARGSLGDARQSATLRAPTVTFTR